MTRGDLETTKQELKESFSAFITKWRSKAAQMINRPNEEEWLTMVVKTFYLYTIKVVKYGPDQTVRLGYPWPGP